MKIEKTSILKKSHEHDKSPLLPHEDEKEQIGKFPPKKEADRLLEKKNHDKEDGGQGVCVKDHFGIRTEVKESIGKESVRLGEGRKGEENGREVREGRKVGGEEGGGKETGEPDKRGEESGEIGEEVDRNDVSIGGKAGEGGMLKKKKTLAFNIEAEAAKSLKLIKSEEEEDSDSKSNTIRTNKTCKPAKIRKRGASAFSSVYNK